MLVTRGKLPAGAVLVIGSGQSGCRDGRGAARGQTGGIPVLRAGPVGQPRRIGEARPVLVAAAYRRPGRPASARCRARLPAGSTCRRPGAAAATTFTTRALEPNGCHAVRPLPRLRCAASPASPRTSPIASPGVISATPSSWTASRKLTNAKRNVDTRDPRAGATRGSIRLRRFDLDLVRRGRCSPAGHRPNYESWVHCPGAFDELGFPIHEEGASTAVLYFVGGALPAQAQIVLADQRRRRGRRARRRQDRSAARERAMSATGSKSEVGVARASAASNLPSGSG